jgi:phosphoserine phosphatase
MLRLVVCDWNGTLLREMLEETFFMGICRRAVLHAIKRGQVGKLVRIAIAGLRGFREYRAALRRPDRVPHHITRIVEMLDPLAFRGLSREELDDYTRFYARRAQPMLDPRLLAPLELARERFGLPVGVISSGCRSGIEATMSMANYPVDFICANDFWWDGDRTAGFRFTLTDNKLQLLDMVLAEHDVEAADVMYIGDGPLDAECFRRVGWPVVSFFASPRHRARFAQSCGAFAPPNQAAFQQHLFDACQGQESGKGGKD